MSIAAVVPTMDEERTIGALTRQLVRLCDPVIVADRSRDLTAVHAELEGATIVELDRPGLGPAYLEAWRQIHPDKWVLHVDAGGSHDYESIINVYVEINEHPELDVIVGSRFIAGGTHEGNWARRQCSRVATAMCRLTSFYGYSDWTSGLRAYSPRARRVLANYPYSTAGHAWQMEALWVAARHGLRVGEVPIHYRAGGTQLNRSRVMEAIGLWHMMAWTK